jgi:hypothetical protein
MILPAACRVVLEGTGHKATQYTNLPFHIQPFLLFLERENAMKKRLMLVVAVLAIATMAYGLLGTGAWWKAPTTAQNNNFQAATFGMTIGRTGTQTVSGACAFTDMVPGGDPKECKIYLTNTGSVPINVVWSGFTLSGDEVMMDNVYLVAFADSNSKTTLADINTTQFDNNPADGKLSIREAAAALGNGWFSDPNNVNDYT